MNAYELADDIKQGNMQNLGNAATMLRQQADRIAELEKRKWSEQDIKNACISAKLSEEDFFRIKAYLPVYSSPQTKPLSDEEIKQIWYNLYPLSSSSYWDDKREGLAELKFARAIEERHGIK